MKPTSCKELKLRDSIQHLGDNIRVEMKPTSCKELKHYYSQLCYYSTIQ